MQQRAPIMRARAAALSGWSALGKLSLRARPV